MTQLLSPSQMKDLAALVERLEVHCDPTDVHIRTPFRLSAFNNNPEYKRRVFEDVCAFLEAPLADLLQDRVPLLVNIFHKTPGSGDDSVAIHQNPSFLRDGQTSVSVWIPLAAVRRENGTVGVLRGSHKAFEHPRAANMPDIFRPCADRLTEVYFEPLELVPGQCAVLDDAIVHWSYPNSSNEVRSAVQVVMLPRGEDPIYYYYDASGPTRLKHYALTPEFFFAFNCKAEPACLPLLGETRFTYADVTDAELVRRVTPFNAEIGTRAELPAAR